MIHNKQAVIVGAAVLAASLTAFAQQNQQRQPNQERQAAIRAAVQALSLSQDQIAQIREIRRERAAEGLDRQARRAWRSAQGAKLQKVLTEDQTKKLAEINAAGTESPEYNGAVFLGLATRQGGNP